MVRSGVGTGLDRAAGLVLLLFAFLFIDGGAASAQDDAYARYVKTAPEFRRVGQIPASRWKTWLYMPWRHRWTAGTDDDGGRFCRLHGINGGFLDYGQGPLLWLEQWDLPFYVDHVAGKGTLFLRKAYRHPGPDVRPVPLDRQWLEHAQEQIRKSLAKVKGSRLRVAYALDDEISWGSLVRPLLWRVHGDELMYRQWRKAAHRDGPIKDATPDELFAQLAGTLGELDFSPLLDRISYNDSVFANFLGELVDTANRIDPETPCGFVGGQAPNLWGGYDYAKLLAKTQFIEVYDNGSAPEIVRSMGRGQTVVSTHFRSKDLHENKWKAWSRFAHGQRGMIAWVDKGWCEGDWLPAFAPTLKELGQRQGRKLVGTQWQHDGIAIYYSQPSIQVSWILDAAAHGKTWPNRNNDDQLGTSHTVRKAWEFLLNDAGLQYDFVGYDTVIRDGVPKEYDVLILPACYALSDAEAQQIRAFAARGGRVVADFACGLFDERGRGRQAGALDNLFGVQHNGKLSRRDLFDGTRWVEVDQDKGYKATRWRERLGGIPGRARVAYTVPESKLAGPIRNGNATYLNLSPLRYLLMREAGRAKPRHIDAFVGPLGKTPVVEARANVPLEIVRWKRPDGGMLLLIVQNPVWHADGSRDVERGSGRVEIRFARPVKNLRDERTGKKLGSGDSFRVEMDFAEAIFLSYR